MKNYYEVKIKRFKVNEEGRERRIVETYLIDALSFTDAEARMYEYAKQHSMKDIVVVGITESKIEKSSYTKMAIQPTKHALAHQLLTKILDAKSESNQPGWYLIQISITRWAQSMKCSNKYL